jgi:hypothetical protein
MEAYQVCVETGQAVLAVALVQLRVTAPVDERRML